ncbi:MAG: hypothetical protein ACP5UM_14970 [Anaerolineae bacterium]
MHLDQARSLILSTVRPVEEVETVPAPEALGRVAAQEVLAREDQPRIPLSRVDGFAVLSSDTARAGPDCPVRLGWEGSSGRGRCLPVA